MIASRSDRGRGVFLSVLGVAIAGWSQPAAGTALDDYIALPDPNYEYTLANQFSGGGYTAYILDMKSQTWRDEPNEVDRELWQHWVKIVKPTTVSSNIGLLWISGGDNGGGVPGSVDSDLRDIARATHTVRDTSAKLPFRPESQ